MHIDFQGEPPRVADCPVCGAAPGIEWAAPGVFILGCNECDTSVVAVELPSAIVAWNRVADAAGVLWPTMFSPPYGPYETAETAAGAMAPCPFCYGKATLHRLNDHADTPFYVECDECLARGPEADSASAAAVWRDLATNPEDR